MRNNRRKKIMVAFLSLIIGGGIALAQTLSLDECRQKAHDNYPAISQYGLIEKSRDLTVSNAAKAWLPGVSVSAYGAAFTDILEMKGQTKAMFGEMKNTLYGGSISVNQVIYDGGSISAKKQVAQAQAEVDRRKMDVTMYDINTRIDQLFFGILMLDEQINQNKLLQDDLSISEKTVQSMMNGGLANQSDLDAVSVRQLQAQQQLINLQAARKTYVNMLGYFMGSELSESVSLERPEAISVSSTSANERPELSYYDSQEQLLNTQRKVLNARMMPTLSLFGLATYHSKIMDTNKDHTLAAGLSLRWNIGALYTRKNDLANIQNQLSQVAVQRETFLFNNRLQGTQSNGTIDNLRQQMALDDKTVALRESIREKAEKKVKNGTETVNELLRDVNAVSEAKQQKAIHEIQLLQEMYNLKTINGR